MSLSSYLTCNLVRGGGGEEYDGEERRRAEPQTATCCTALQRGFHAQPRYAPLRTPASAAAGKSNDADDEAMRKCKSTLERLPTDGPRLRRSAAVRRDWSFEDLRANKAA
uniref:Uncharacterized protein n=1 Tax=Oryza brachyantha TaxID=4533 RepID=J3L8R4_ORYBR